MKKNRSPDNDSSFGKLALYIENGNNFDNKNNLRILQKTFLAFFIGFLECYTKKLNFKTSENLTKLSLLVF